MSITWTKYSADRMFQFKKLKRIHKRREKPVAAQCRKSGLILWVQRGHFCCRKLSERIKK